MPPPVNHFPVRAGAKLLVPVLDDAMLQPGLSRDKHRKRSPHTPSPAPIPTGEGLAETLWRGRCGIVVIVLPLSDRPRAPPARFELAKPVVAAHHSTVLRRLSATRPATRAAAASARRQTAARRSRGVDVVSASGRRRCSCRSGYVSLLATSGRRLDLLAPTSCQLVDLCEGVVV